MSFIEKLIRQQVFLSIHLAPQMGWLFQMGCTDRFEFWVMNRWGEVIFYSNDVNVGMDTKIKMSSRHLPGLDTMEQKTKNQIG